MCMGYLLSCKYLWRGVATPWRSSLRCSLYEIVWRYSAILILFLGAESSDPCNPAPSMMRVCSWLAQWFTATATVCRGLKGRLGQWCHTYLALQTRMRAREAFQLQPPNPTHQMAIRSSALTSQKASIKSDIQEEFQDDKSNLDFVSATPFKN